MKRLRKSLLVAVGAIELLLLLTALARPAYGYVDPGSGLLAIQVGGSMLAGALFMLRAKVRKLLNLSARLQENGQENPTASAE